MKNVTFFALVLVFALGSASFAAAPTSEEHNPGSEAGEEVRREDKNKKGAGKDRRGNRCAVTRDSAKGSEAAK